MVKTITFTIKNNKRHIFFVAGISKRFGVGVYLDKWSFGIDIGPFWVSLEW